MEAILRATTRTTAPRRGRGATGVTRVAFASLLALAFVPATAAAVPGEINTVAGTGTAGFSGDGGPAASAQLSGPNQVAATADGGYLIADQINSRVRKVSPTGTITTVAGTGSQGFSGDGGPAVSAQLSNPSDIAPTADGGFLIADQTNGRIRAVSPAGIITTVAGTGSANSTGDGGAATAASFLLPAGVAATADGGFLVADDSANNVRKISAGGIISTVAGRSGPMTGGDSGDGGPATAALLQFPRDVVATADGGFLIADSTNDRIRKVSAGGVITTVAGDGTSGSSGDGGLATSAKLSSPEAVTPTADGGFLIADGLNTRIRSVSAAGTITTVAGGGSNFPGDGGAATAAGLSPTSGVALMADGSFLLAEGDRIRRVEPGVFTGPGGGGGSLDTKITKGPKKKTKKRKAKFSFKAVPATPGATFVCKLDKKKFKPCTSPTRTKRLRRGKHVFTVAAVDAAGLVDSTPAVRKFKVKKKRKR